MRVFFTNLGCKLNQAEVEALARRFTAAGHCVVDRLDAADLHVVNSCTVTHVAARDSRKAARRGGRLERGVRTVVTGCFATEQPEASARLAGVDLVVPNAAKEGLLERVVAAFPELAATERAPAEVPVPYVPLELGNTRALVKVEDGCDMRCAFCIIPFTRGRQRSRPVAEVVDEVAGRVATGAREVVVTGVQISSYRGEEGARLVDLTRAILERTRIERLRLTSIAPWQLDDRLVELFADPRLCRHVHLSLQSGCSETLRRMRRPYTAAEYAEQVAKLRSRIPGLAVTTDVIVGFPGETAEEFEASRSFVEELAFAKVHVFPYSSREGTAAAAMTDPVPHAAIRERVERMIATASRGEEAFREEHLGRSLRVLWERKRRGRWLGLTDNYLRVAAVSGADLHNRIVAARAVALDGESLVAEIEAGAELATG